MACSVLDETINSFTKDFIEMIEKAGIVDMTPTLQTLLAGLAASTICAFLSNRSHVAAQHSGAELNRWGTRMYEEARLIVQALAAVGFTNLKNNSLPAAAAEVAHRTVMLGENCIMKFHPDTGWSAHTPTAEELEMAREALRKGQDVIPLGADESASSQQQPVSPNQALDPSFLEGWEPGPKAN